MQLTTTRFGTIEIADEDIITFSQPIIGFQNQRRYIHLPGPTDSVVSWLQAVESSELAFLLMDPRLVCPDYHVDLSAGDLNELGAASVQELEVYTLVVVPQDRSQVRTNLKAPVLIHPKSRRGKQQILDRSDYPIQFFLSPAREDDEPHTEVQHARSDT